MWQAKIARTERNGNRLDIIIHYSNGVTEYDQVVSTTTPQSETWINDRINEKLIELTNLDVYENSLKDEHITESAFDIDPITKEVFKDDQAIELTPVPIVEPIEIPI
jgi:hypothetical protein